MATATVTNSFTNGTTADADQVNTNFNDLISFLNASVVHVDGTKAMSAALAMGSNKITGLAAGTADTDAANFKQSDHFVVQFTQSGELVVGAGAVRWYPPFDCEIIKAVANVGVAPTGADLQVDVNRDGTTIFTTQSLRPIVAAAGFVDESGTPDGTATLTALTNYVTVDVDQIGSTLPGEDLVVTIHLRRT